MNGACVALGPVLEINGGAGACMALGFSGGTTMPVNILEFVSVGILLYGLSRSSRENCFGCWRLALCEVSLVEFPDLSIS